MSERRNMDTAWDLLNSTDLGEEDPPKKLFTVDMGNEENVSKWLNTTLHYHRSIREHLGYTDQLRSNLQAYKGNFTKPGTVRRDEKSNIVHKSNNTGKIGVNQTYEIVEQLVSHMARFKPNVEILPANIEKADRDSAAYGKIVKQHLEGELKTDILFEKLQRWKTVFGESLLMPTFDASKGPIHPDYKAVVRDKKGKQISSATIKGEELTAVTIKDEEGNTITLDTAVHVGDVVAKLYPPFRYYDEICQDKEDSEYRIVEDIVDIEWVEAKYKHFDREEYKRKKEEGKSHSGRYQLEKLPNGKVRFYKLFHKRTEFMYEGRFIEWIDGYVLTNTTHPYDHKELPGVVLTDIDVPTDMYAMSTVELIAPLNRIYNNVTTNMAKSIAMLARPMIMAKRGQVDFKQFQGFITVMQYKSEKPTVATVPVISGDTFAFRDEIKKDIESISGIHGVSRGEPPPGIRAGIALNFLEEQENKRANSAIIKVNSAIETFWRQCLSLAGQFYDPADGRTAKIVGRDGQFTVKSLKEVDLTGPFSIHVQNASALPESKAGRLQAILDLREILGEETIPNEQVADVLDLAQPEKYVSYVTVAHRKAEAEDEEMLRGNDVESPQRWEEHITHWTTHIKRIQSSAFGEDVPTADKERFFNHILTHEMFIEQIRVISPAFDARVSELVGYPAFWEPEESSPLAPANGQTDPLAELGQVPEGGLDPAALAPNGAEVPVGAPIPEAAPIDAVGPALPPEIPLGEQ